MIREAIWHIFKTPVLILYEGECFGRKKAGFTHGSCLVRPLGQGQWAPRWLDLESWRGGWKTESAEKRRLGAAMAPRRRVMLGVWTGGE